MKALCIKLAAAATLAFATSAYATPIGYADPGVENTVTYTFTATATGNITAYFAGSDASYVNEVTMLVNGVATGVYGLNNHTTTYGTALDLGSVVAGDSIVFELVSVNPSNVGPWYSDTSLNTDGMQHIYSAAYAGDSVIPEGILVGFEDLPGGGDLDYNDENFVFTNVAAVTPSGEVPEPASLALLLAGAAGFGASRKRAKRAAGKA